MAAEDRIREAIENFQTRVRQDLDVHGQSLGVDLTSALQAERDAWRADQERALNDAGLEADRARQADVESARAECARDTEARVEAERAARTAALETLGATLHREQVEAFTRLAAAVRHLDQAASLRGILEALADGARNAASRVALLLVELDTLRMWGHFGYDGGPGLSELPVDADSLLKSAVGGRQTTKVPAEDGAGEGRPAFMRRPAGHAGLIFPLMVGGNVVAVLYADGPERQPETGAAPVWTEQLDILVLHAALRLENVTSLRTVEALTSDSATSR
jgi:hypothetical protein